MAHDMPADCRCARASDVQLGDQVRFRNPRSDYIVEAVDRRRIGSMDVVQHRAHDGTMTCGYAPDEVLWITRCGDQA